jgi:hypothetical protein
LEEKLFILLRNNINSQFFQEFRVIIFSNYSFFEQTAVAAQAAVDADVGAFSFAGLRGCGHDLF